MIGKVFEIVNEMKSDMRSAAEKKEEYDRLQRFFKSPPYEATSIMDFSKYSLTAPLRRLKDKWNKAIRNYIERKSKVPQYLSGLRKDKLNGNKMRMASVLKGDKYRKNLND